MSNVKALYGGVVIAAREPNEELIAALERWLDAARSGEVQGMGFVALHADMVSSRDIAGVLGGYGMIGAAFALAGDLQAVFDESA